MPKEFSLERNERLKSRKLIDQLFSKGKHLVVAPYRVYYLIDNKEFISTSPFNMKFGIGVSGKNFKKAVDRNKIKRLTREAYRLQKNELSQFLKVSNKHINLFFIYTAKDLPHFNTVMEKVKLILNKLVKLIDENNSSDS